MNPVSASSPAAVQAAIHPRDSSSPATHAKCVPGTCGFYEDISAVLPPFPRSVTLSYLDNEEKARCFQVCGAAVPPPIVAFPEEARAGWQQNQYTDETIRNLFVEKMMMVTADAARRSAAYKTNTKVLETGFWYAEDYFKYLQEKKQAKRLNFLQEKGSFIFGLPPKGFFKKDPYDYQLEEGTLPTQGLANVRQTLCFFDCQEARQLAQYEAVLEIFGSALFDETFKASGEIPLRFNTMLQENEASDSLLSVGALLDLGNEGTRPVGPGEAAYFHNLAEYRTKHRRGHMQGLHVVCTQHKPIQKFVGFGTPPEGLTEKQIFALFAKAFNETPLLTSELCNATLTRKIHAVEIAAGKGPETLHEGDKEVSGMDILEASLANPGEVGFDRMICTPDMEMFNLVAQQKRRM